MRSTPLAAIVLVTIGGACGDHTRRDDRPSTSDGGGRSRSIVGRWALDSLVVNDHAITSGVVAPEGHPPRRTRAFPAAPMTDRDYSSISQSAKWLALTRATTAIPFAREAAMLLFGEAVVREAEATVAALSAHRLRHFEHRYRSIDQALELVGHRNIVEIGAGLSFRGLVMAQSPGVHYLDSDLPELLAVKADLVARLEHPPLQGTLRLEPLDALAPGALAGAVRHLPAGPVAVVNEGLLMYLDASEKERLAAGIRGILQERTGSRWITADCYIRDGERRAALDPQVERFVAEHRVEEQKFASWESAERFFELQGFAIERRLKPSEARHIRETWILALA